MELDDYYPDACKQGLSEGDDTAVPNTILANISSNENSGERISQVVFYVSQRLMKALVEVSWSQSLC